MLVTDVHAHYVPKGWPMLPGGAGMPRLRIDGPRAATIMQGEREFRRITDHTTMLVRANGPPGLRGANDSPAHKAFIQSFADKIGVEAS